MNKLALTLTAGAIAMACSLGLHASDGPALHVKLPPPGAEAPGQNSGADSVASGQTRAEPLRGLDRDIIRRQTPPAPKPAENNAPTEPTYGPVIKVKPKGVQ